MIDPKTGIEIGKELDGVRHELATAKEAHKKTLDVLEALTNAGKLQETCPHDAEPDFCDGCAVEREKQVGEARKQARARLRECGRVAKP